MKKLCKTLFLAIIFTFAVCISSYAAEIDIIDSTSSVKLEAADGILPDDSTLKATVITEGERFEAIKSILNNEKYVIYDISVLSSDSEVSPTGTIKLSFPIPSEYNSDNLIVYRVDESNVKTECSITINNDYAVIESTQLGNYVLAEKYVEQIPDNEPITLTDSTNGAKLVTTSSAVSESDVFKAAILTEGEKFEEIKALMGDAKYSIFDVSLVDIDGTAVTLDETSTLILPVSNGLNIDSLKIYFIDEEGSKQECNFEIADNSYASLQISKFGHYVLVNEATKEETSVISIKDSTTNIRLDALAGVVPDDTTLKVEAITEGERFDAIKSVLDNEKFCIFNISLISNGSAIQPSGNVKISIPIPTGYDRDNLIAYRIDSDGTKTEYSVKIDGDYAVIETNHFSDYVLAEKLSASSTEEQNNTSDSKLDSEPKTGINNPVSFVVTVLVIACLGLALCIKKISK